uniref:Multidrug efflux system subunit MdtA n=1 Tax=uncultured bacterium CSLG7 TaxID=1091577 RepID=G4WV27_9BACT|nr:multidrug efflux system subunit MdtA [uncultured bacterium CSLG7]
MNQNKPSILETQSDPPLALPPGEPQLALPPPGASAAPRPPRSKFLWILVPVLLAGAIWGYFHWSKASASGKPPAAGKNADGKGSDVTQVVAAKARLGNIGVYFNGLGAVTPIYTVTLRSRVDGELTEIHYREGDAVHQGDLLVQIDPRPFEVQLTEAEGQLAKDEAALANARIDLTRYQTLLAQNAIQEQQVATQKALVTQDEGTVKSDQGQVDSAKLNLVYCKITAPITGRIGLRLVDPGNIVHASDTTGLLVITQIEPISVLFTVAEDQLPTVLQKMRTSTLEVDAYDRDMKKKLAQGTLTTVDNQIDQTTGTVRLRATFDNKDDALFPNQFVNARLLVQEKRGVVLLPSAAIQRSSNATFVYLVKPDSTVTVRNITEGTTEGDDSEITAGLNAGDTVVMTGADKLQEGSKVNAQIQQDTSSKKAGAPKAGVNQ